MVMSISPEPQALDDVSRFQQAGKQTAHTPEVMKLATGFQGTPLDRTNQILAHMKSLRVTRFDDNLFRKRSASQILEQGFVTGCTDADLVFVTLARACGIPAKYVETIDRSWLEKGGDIIQGHQYAEIYDTENKRWIWVNPMGNKVDIQSPENDNRVVYRIGLDSWDIGINDFHSLSENFNRFRETWLEQNHFIAS